VDVVADARHGWWHFQWRDGHAGKQWLALMESIGFTEEGLAGLDRGKTIYGLYGMGYSIKALDGPAV
jgi:hypothetical protein